MRTLPKATTLDCDPTHNMKEFQSQSLGSHLITTAVKVSASMKNSEDVDKIRGYNELLDEYSLHQFIIRKGKTLSSTPIPILSSYKSAKLGNIVTVINALESIPYQFQVPLAYIDGKSIMQLAEDEPQNLPMMNCLNAL